MLVVTLLLKEVAVSHVAVWAAVCFSHEGPQSVWATVAAELRKLSLQINKYRQTRYVLRLRTSHLEAASRSLSLEIEKFYYSVSPLPL